MTGQFLTNHIIKKMPWWTFHGDVPEINAHDLHNLIQKETIQLVDVRTVTEYNGGHIKGAISCSLFPSIWSFRERILKLNLDKEKPVYTVCLSAHRSIPATKLLIELGYKATQLKGGMLEWRKQKLPEEVN